MENGKKSVIVVEAKPEAARLTERLLVANGYRVLVASADSDVAALARMDRGATALVAADAGSPDGFALTQTLVQAVSGLRAVVIDGTPSVERALKAEAAGAFDYLPRPFPAATLRETLTRSYALLPSARDPRRNLEVYLAANGASRPAPAAAPAVAPLPAEPQAPERRPSVPKASVARRPGVQSEDLALLDLLADGRLVGAAQAAELRERLTKREPAATGTESLLALLEATDPAAAAKCLAHLADLAKTSPVPLDMYPVLERNFGSVDQALLERHMAVPFARIADQTLVALPNPTGERARAELSAAFGGSCRFFVCTDSAARTALAKIKKLREGGAAE